MDIWLIQYAAINNGLALTNAAEHFNKEGKIRMRRKLLQGITAAVFSLAMATTSAHALSLDPSQADWTSSQNSNCDAACVSQLTGIAGLVELYKQNNDGSEAGSLADSYTTTFNGDLSAFTIAYNGGPEVICGTCVLLVKDGNQDPNQYVFNISAGTVDFWNGTESIFGSNFWPGPGSISHAAIYNVGGTVPEPTSLLLLGAGVAGVSLMRRKAA